MYELEDFKRRFRNIDTDELLANAWKGLSEEAMQATREVLAERGIKGDALERRFSEVGKQMDRK